MFRSRPLVLHGRRLSCASDGERRELTKLVPPSTPRPASTGAMSAPPPAPSFSSFPDLNFLNPPPPPKPESSSTRDKERDREGDRPSKRSRRSPVDEDRSFGRSRRETEDERRERKDRERRRDRDRDDKDRYSSSRRKDRDDRDRPSSSSGPTPPVPAPSEPQSASSTLFYKDTKGDEGNKTYGSLHAPSVAKFHRSGGTSYSPKEGLREGGGELAHLLTRSSHVFPRHSFSWERHRPTSRCQDHSRIE